MPTSISIDASVAIKTIVEERFSDLARKLIAENDLILAPAHAYAEITEIIYRKHIAGDIDEKQALMAIERLPRILTLVPLDAIMADAFRIAKEIRHSVYDCLYVAAALKCGTTLVTADTKLVLKCRGTRLSETVRELATVFS